MRPDRITSASVISLLVVFHSKIIVKRELTTNLPSAPVDNSCGLCVIVHRNRERERDVVQVE